MNDKIINPFSQPAPLPKTQAEVLINELISCRPETKFEKQIARILLNILQDKNGTIHAERYIHENPEFLKE